MTKMDHARSKGMGIEIMNIRLIWRQVMWSTYPMSKNICLISVLTFKRGWRWPVGRAAPIASKLYALKVLSFQEPLHEQRMKPAHTHTQTQTSHKLIYSYLWIISGVSSTSCFAICVVKSLPRLTTKHLTILHHRGKDHYHQHENNKIMSKISNAWLLFMQRPFNDVVRSIQQLEGEELANKIDGRHQESE